MEVVANPDTIRTAPPSSPEEFRSLMAGFPTGVAIVTAVDRDGRPWGMTCSALCSVSVDPPTLAVGMRAESPTLRAALESDAFTVNLLHAQGRSAAELFASGAPDRFDSTEWSMPEYAAGPHLTEAAHAVADCRITQIVVVGERRMVFGEVIQVIQLADDDPLLYGSRRYGTWSATQPRSHR
ncbi:MULTISPECIES: flavin reductase family protein [unclassified Kitasatospora]|uniref:flavin reductase family protein n=1 Tax=unclassified Kitasatospora TaxID=2633591 RepID=UPI0033F37AFE